MDMKSKIIKKFNPKVLAKMCETCAHKRGDFFKDPEEQNEGEITRVYCKARYTSVNVKEMQKYCDFFSLKVKTE